MTAVIALEHTQMPPGTVAEVLLAWMQAVLPGTTTRIAPGCVCPERSGDAPGQRLEQALTALPPWARPYLSSLITPIDKSFLARTSQTRTSHQTGHGGGNDDACIHRSNGLGRVAPITR